MPTFENGWICRECWCANRETDERCYRCHAVPKRHEMPEPTTFSTPDGMPNEERKKVSSLTGPAVAREPEASPPKAPTPKIPLSERMRSLVIVTRVRAAIAALTLAFARLTSFGRAVRHAPGTGARRLSQGVSGARHEAGSRWRSALAHRRAWLAVAWVISAFSCALLFSAVLHAPFAASLLMVISVAVFSGLTAAATSNVWERQARGMTERSADTQAAAERVHTFVPAPDLPPQSADVLGSRSAR
jgi:hypothetical protein